MANDEYKLGDGLKKLLLAGVGAVAVTGEKGQELLEVLVKKGELTVEQGKELSREWKDNAKKAMDERKTRAADGDDLGSKIQIMTMDELENLKAKIKDAEEAIKNKMNGDDSVIDGKAEEIREAAGDFAEKAKDMAQDAAASVKEAAQKVMDSVNKDEDGE